MAAQGGYERDVQKSYSIEHSVDLTVEAMMLDSKASDLDKEERPEVLSLSPPYKGQSVVELGASIGRFTGELAKEAGEVLAMDFIERVIKKNESINGHFMNVKFICADVTSPDLKITSESVDLILSNWLLMYLSDNEVENLAKRMVKWLKVGGYIFFRESCFHQSGDSKRKSNPTHYREPRFYTKVFKECNASDGNGNTFELSLISCKCIGAYVKNKKNQNQSVQILTRDSSDSWIMCNTNVVAYYATNASLAKVLLAQEELDKPALLKTFFKWLKPGGKVLISDYCRSAGTPSTEFAEYIKQRGYDLHDVEAYGQMLKDAGFYDVIAEDRTDQFINVLEKELNAVEKDREEFISDFSEEDYNEIVGGWKAKLARSSSSGEQRWGLFIAKKK